MIKVNAITPRRFRPEVFRRFFVPVVERTINLADKQFAKTYATWDHKPKFTKRIKAGIGTITGEASTDDQIYRWLNDGTRKNYPIPKAGPGLLVFSSGYKAKTTPRTMFSQSGGPFGPAVFVTGQVIHPGIDAREWDKTARIFVEPWFRKWAQIALKQASKASGHAYP